MKNYSVIEDLDLDYYQSITIKNFTEKLYDCFIRNFNSIKKYSNYQQELLLSKFKKNVISKYAQQIVQYSKEMQVKNRKLFYTRRRISKEDLLMNRKSRKTFSQLVNGNNFSKIQPNSYYVQKITSKQNNTFLTVQQQTNHTNKTSQIPNQVQSNKLQSKQAVFKFFDFHTKQIKKIENSLSQNKIKASIYNDTIIFPKKFQFQTTLSKISRTKEQKQAQQSKINLSKIRFSTSQQMSLQKKMIDILKQRKANKKYRLKIDPGQLHGKNLLDWQQNKQNMTHNCGQQSQMIKQAKQKIGQLNLALKGKLILLPKHRISNSCTFQQMNIHKSEDSNNNKILVRQKEGLYYQGLWSLKSSQKQYKLKHEKQLPNILQKTLQRFRKQKPYQKSFSLPKF